MNEQKQTLTKEQEDYLDDAYDRQRDFELDAKADAEELYANWLKENLADLKQQFIKDNDLNNSRHPEDDNGVDTCTDLYPDEFKAYCDDMFVEYCEGMRLKHI